VLNYQGDFDKSLQMLKEGLTISRATGSQKEFAEILAMFSTALACRGDLDEGYSKLEESVALLETLGKNYSLALWIAFLGMLQMWLGRYEEARLQSERAIAISTEIDYPRGIGMASWVMGNLALLRGAYSEALVWAQRSYEILQEIEQSDDKIWSLSLLANVTLVSGDIPQAQHYIRETILAAIDIHSFWGPIFLMPVVALYLIQRGEKERAIEIYALAACYPLVEKAPWFHDLAMRQVVAFTAALPTKIVFAAQARGKVRDMQSTLAELLRELEGTIAISPH